MKYRIVCLILLTVIVASAILGSCGKKDTVTNETNTSSSDSANEGATEHVDSLDARASADESLPDDLNFNGEEFFILGLKGIKDFTIAEEEPSERVESALYHRDFSVESRLNVVIKYDARTYNELADTFRLAIATNEDQYDLYLGQALVTGADVLNDSFINWNEIMYVDFDKPWYPPNTINELSVNNRMYMCVGAMNMSALGFTNCMFYDKDAAASYGIDDVYGIVKSESWTYDRLYELTKDVYVDKNLDNVADAGDFYGLSARDGDIPVFMWAFDQKLVSFNDDGIVDITFNSEKTSDIIDKVRKLYYNNPGTSTVSPTGADFHGITMFMQDRSMFTFGYVDDSLSKLTEKENYGIIPYPKYDEAQEEYYTIVDGSFTVSCIPLTVKNTDIVGAVAEAMNAYSWKYVEPEYYDIALKYRGTRDDDSIEMLDLIFNGRVMDLQYIHDAWKGFAFSLQIICQPNSTVGLSSFFSSKEKAAMAYYNSVVDYYFFE